MILNLDTNYYSIPFTEYLAWPEISQTNIKAGCTSMLLMKHSTEHSKPPTDAMLLGSAIGCAFLEPELLPERVILWEGARRVGKDWDAFKQLHKGKIILTKGMYSNFKNMITALHNHPQISQWIGLKGENEVSRIAEIMGVRVKGRVDRLLDDIIIDIKSTGEDLDEEKMAKLIIDKGHHIQGAIYCRIFKRNRFALGMVESTAPHDVVPYELDRDLLAFGWREAQGLILNWKSCCEKNHWPGRSETIVEIGLPNWLKSEAGYEQITKGGKPVFT